MGEEMEELTCPNCNVDVDPVELKQNNLHCPTCGFDMSEAEEPADFVEAARIFPQVRWKGVTLPPSNGLIASLAMRLKLPV